MTVDDLVVNLIDQYKVELLLAAKPYTDHYLAYDVDDDRSVTLDVLRVDSTPGGFAAQFVSRARAIAQIRHPNILRIHTVGRTSADQPYVAQAQLDAYPLSQRLEQLAARPGSVNTIYALKLVRQLADALLLATRLDLLHYDLRPQNVLLKNVALPTDDVLVLTDLFIPFERRNWNASDEAVELVAYLSPEQRAGKDIDAASHVYSLGVLAYHLLAAVPPAGPTHAHDVVLRRLTAGGTPLERLRSGLALETVELVDRALRHDPRQRYESIEAFVLALEEALLAEELLVSPAALPAAPPRRRLWTLLTIVVLLALSIVAALTGARLIGSQTATPTAALIAEGGAAGEPPLGTTPATAAPQGGDEAPAVVPPPPATATEPAPATEQATLTTEPSATATPPATATDSPTATPTATATATRPPPSPTAEPRVRTDQNSVFLRRGPGTNYLIIGTLLQGQDALVLARFGEGENTWFEVRTAEGQTGWLSASIVELGDGHATGAIPTASVIPPTPVPTATPSPTATPTAVATPTLASPGGGEDGGPESPPQPTQPAPEPSRTPPPLEP